MGTKRKAKPAVDFKKTKPKLGKGKQLADNATDTSFKSKSIAMPQQSIMLDRSHALTTKRRQTLGDLVQNAQHHSPSVRKDAVLGMMELIHTYSEFLELHCATLINAVLPLIGDDDIHVRTTVAKYFSVVLESMNYDAFLPFASPMLLITTSAMSHISMTVRIDALRILSLLLNKVPALATKDWEAALDTSSTSNQHGQRILQAFFAMLGVGADARRQRAGVSTVSTASVSLGASQRLSVIRALSQFLCAATRTEQAHDMPTWCFQSAFTSPSDRERFEHLFAPSVEYMQWTIADIPGATTLNVCEALVSGAQVEGSSEFIPMSACESLIRVLHPSLLSTLLDSLPSAMAPDGSTSDTDAELIMHILQVHLILWRRIVMLHVGACLSHGATHVPVKSMGRLEQLLTHLAPYFSGRAEAQQRILLHVHVVYCELVALHTAIASEKTQTKHLSSALSFLVSLLSDNTTLTPYVYGTLLPTFWLVILSQMEGSVDVLVAMLSQFNSSRDRELQSVAFRFLARLAMLPTFNSVRVDTHVLCNSLVRPLWNEWLLSLSRLMWQSATLAVSSRASRQDSQSGRKLLDDLLAFFRWVSVTNRHPIFDHHTIMMELGLHLRPLFYVEHPKRARVPGPYHKLPPASQHLAQALTKLVPNLESMPCI